MAGATPAKGRSGFAPVLALVLFMLPAPVFAQDFQTSVARALLLDVGTGTVLFEKNADETFPPASLAKIMTAEMLFHEISEGRLSLEKELLVSEHAWRTGGAPSRSTAMFASVNSRIAISDLLKGLTVPSGNDAAIALAEGISGTEQSFVEAMNRRVREIGLENSVFINASGLEPRPQSRTSGARTSGARTSGTQAPAVQPDLPQPHVTARDMMVLARHIIETYPELYRYFAEPELTWNKIRQQNRNPLLAMNIGADGFLTGYTEQAGFGLVGSAVQNGQRLIVVISGAATARDRDQEARKLLEWGFRAFETRELFTAGQTVGEASVYGGEKGSVPLVSSQPIRVLVQRGSQERITARIRYRGPLIAPVEKGMATGYLEISRGSLVSLDMPLVTGEAVAAGSIPARARDAVLEMGTDTVRRAFEKLMADK